MAASSVPYKRGRSMSKARLGGGSRSPGPTFVRMRSTSRSPSMGSPHSFGGRIGMIPSYVGYSGTGSGERKVIDVLQTAFAPETTGTQLLLLNGCQVGTQNYNRIGRKIRMRSIAIRGQIQPTDTTIAATMCRMIIVYDRQTNGAAPTYANIMQSQDITGTTASTAFSMVNLDNRDRFVIVRDKFYGFGAIDSTATQALSSASPGIYPINEYVKCKFETIFNTGSAGTVGDISSGSLYLFWVASNASAAGVQATVSTRLRFDDP